jgi:hypothetical protein
LRWSVTRLPGNDEVVGLKLLDQRLVDAALGAVGQARRFGRGDRHGLAESMRSSQRRMSNPPRSARLRRATSTMLSSEPALEIMWIEDVA